MAEVMKKLIMQVLDVSEVEVAFHLSFVNFVADAVEEVGYGACPRHTN